MVPLDNPAGKLHYFLSKLKKLPDNTSFQDAIIKIIKPEETSQHNLFKIMLRLNGLLKKAHESVENLESPHKELYLEPFKNFHIILSSVNLNQPIANFKNILNDVNLKGLEFCSAKLSEGITEHQIAEADLKDIQALIENLIKDLLDSKTLDKNLKQIIVTRLKDLLVVIINYRLFGNDAIQEEFELIMGTVFVRQNQFRENADNKDVNRLWKILGKISTVLSITANLQKLAGPFFPALLEKISK